MRENKDDKANYKIEEELKKAKTDVFTDERKIEQRS